MGAASTWELFRMARGETRVALGLARHLSRSSSGPTGSESMDVRVVVARGALPEIRQQPRGLLVYHAEKMDHLLRGRTPNIHPFFRRLS